MTKLDERGAHAADELRRELASLSVPEPTRLVRRARHTRIVTAAAAVLVVGIASLALARAVDSHSSTRISTGNQPPSAPHDASPSPRGAVGNVPTPTTAPTPLGAPLVEGPDAASTLLTSWGAIHVGYVFVYADGRVIRYPDGLPSIERRLTRRGLDLVRAGKLDAKWFLGQGVLRPYPHWKIWADRAPRIWEPSKYAICSGNNEVWSNAADVLGELPAPVQAVLDGKQRIYDPSIGTAQWPEFVSPGPPGPLSSCFEVTAAEVANLYRIFLANGQIVDTWKPPYAWQAVAGRVALIPYEVYPHGQPVLSWGG